MLKCVDCRAKKLPVLPLYVCLFVCVFCVFYVLIFIIYIHKDTANTQTHTHSNAGSVSWSQIHLSCLLLCAGELFPMSSWFSPPTPLICMPPSFSHSACCKAVIKLWLPLPFANVFAIVVVVVAAVASAVVVVVVVVSVCCFMCLL